MIVDLIALLVGLACLTWSADRFVGGAKAVSSRLGISTMVVGALVIGFGTSAPELVVSTVAAAQGELDLGIGNVIGSNVANLTLVLGMGAAIRTLVLPGGTISRGFLCLGSVVLFAWLVQGEASRLEGVILGTAALLGLVLLARMPSDEGSSDVGESLDFSAGSAWRWTVLGLIGTVVSAQAVVYGAIGLAEDLGIGGGFVGFSIVAVGTSLPELFTVVTAARRGETGLIVGNLLGSNLFNSLLVGSAIFLAGPGPVVDVELQSWGSVIMVAIAALAVLHMLTGRRIGRFEGLTLLAAYGALLVFLGLSAGV